ncbi:MAG: hypothetical protein M1830_004221, partial [Pleopsidium flavum]
MLCIDSPEGHTAEDLGDDLDIGDKDTLSFSWRALKEASSLLHAMLVNKTYSPQASGTGLQYEDLQRIGRLSFTQLAELRHRGAFSTVSQTFAACCVRCAQSPEKAIRDLLATWYKDTLLCIQDKGSKITRRSAGIPSLMSGILAAHPEKTVKKAFLDLQAIARSPVEAENGLQDISLPQVHALNSIKALYVNTKLGAYSEAYVSEGLDLAGACLESKIWAIRNCGLMLFRALIDRLFGTSEQLNQTEPNNHARALRLSYDKYPNLPRLLVRLLGGDILGDLSKQDDDTDVSSATPAEIVFPALEIIRRAGSPAQENVIISTLVMQHLGSKIWNVREMAARTYCSLVAEKEYLEKIALLLDLDWCTSNRLHGIMLSVKFLIGKHFRFEREYWREDLVCIISILEPYFDVIVVHTRCPFTQAAYLDIVNHVMWGILMTQDRRTVGTAFDTVDNLSLRASFCKKVEELRRDMQSKHELPNRSRIGHAESLLRQSAAWSLALYYVARSRFSHLKDLSQQLSDTDPDTACATLASLASPLLSQDCIYEGSALYYDIIHTSGYAEVRAVATKGYLHILDRTLSVQERRNSNKQSNASKSALSPFVERRVRRTTSGSGELDHDLRMRGYSLLAICGNNPVLPKEVEEKLEDWSRMLRLAGGERSIDAWKDFSTRYAAVSSVKAFKAVLRPMGGVPNTSSALLDVYLALYDTLNDDDEEVRDLGADIVSWIVSTTPLHYPSQSLVPLAASLRFSKFLANTYSTSSNLFVQATKRLIGQTEDHYCLDIIRSEDNAVKAMKIQSVHDLLISARTEDTSLFVQEKQNLFIDE